MHGCSEHQPIVSEIVLTKCRWKLKKNKNKRLAAIILCHTISGYPCDHATFIRQSVKQMRTERGEGGMMGEKKKRLNWLNRCSPEFFAAFPQVPLEKELLLLLCLLNCLAPGRSNRKLNTYPLSLQLNSCLWYAKHRTCHRNEKKNCLHVNKK